VHVDDASKLAANGESGRIKHFWYSICETIGRGCSEVAVKICGYKPKALLIFEKLRDGSVIRIRF